MKAYIKGISYYLPENTLDNETIIGMFPEWSAEKVVNKVGVKVRHIAAPGQTSSDMAVEAARNLFRDYGISPADIGFVLFCTQSPDYFMPASACNIQHRLGIPSNAGALDYNLGCSGFVYGLALAKGLIAAGIADNILLLTADTFSRFLHPRDKSATSIFGDAAAATLVSSAPGFAEIGELTLGTDGRGIDNLIVANGAFRHPERTGIESYDESGAIKSDDYLYMNGGEVFNFTLDAVPPLIRETMEKNGIADSDVSWYVFHQANKYMLTTLRKFCGLDKERFYIDMEDSGNITSSTIPVALARLLRHDRMPAGTSVVISGFGVGYSWGAGVLKIMN